MSAVKPSQVAEAIVTMFGVYATDLETDRPNHAKQVEVRALLSLLDNVPPALINLTFTEFLEYQRCYAALATILPSWNLGNTMACPGVAGKNPVERIRRLVLSCPDELPRPEPELLFMTDEAARIGAEAKVHAAWINFKAGEWLGATVFAGCALEAILLWEVKRSGEMSESTANKKHLTDLIGVARSRELISGPAADLAKLARDGRDLLHPGKVARQGTECTNATALTALAAVAQVVEELNRQLAAKS